MSSLRSTEPSTRIHVTAIVDSGAQLGEGVTVGPWTFIGPGVVIGDGTVIGPRALIERDTVVGRGCRLHTGAVLGTDPQDMKYRGEHTTLTVGDRSVVREFATLNRGTAAEGVTSVGSDCLIMAYAHVAHDCRLGDHVVIANSVAMGGHVRIGDWAVIGGITPIHQFVRIGEHAFVGGGSRIAQDVPPYCRAAGNPPSLYGINSIGLTRREIDPEVRATLKKAYRLVFNSKEPLADTLRAARAELPRIPEVERLLDFVRESERGVTI